ncbi:MAG: rhomboid family intramembrane serine protease [Pseudomonadales bacterium]
MHSDEQTPWVLLQTDRNRSVIADAALVLTAMGISNRSDRSTYEWQLYVPSESRDAATQQLELYRRENTPITLPKVLRVDTGWPGVVGYLLVIWLVPALEGMFGEIDWRASGQMDVTLVSAGEWWRLFCALTLHADLPHIVANSFFGAVFGLMVGRHLGSGFGWLLVLLAGGLGNGINAFFRPEGFLSMGASTATFAEVGLVAAYVAARGYFRGSGFRRNAAPIFGAIALLVFTGISGARTDILAHCGGLFAGVVLGAAASSFDIRRLGKSGQWIAGGIAVGILMTAWSHAI